MVEQLAAEYELGEVAGWSTLRTGSSVTVFRLEIIGRSVVVREVSRPPEQVTRQNELVEFLADRGFPVAPPLRTRSNRDMVEIGGRAYVAYPLIEGTHAPPRDPHVVHTVGTVLARLHEHTGNYSRLPPNPRQAMRDRFLKTTDDSAQHAKTVQSDASLHPIHGAAAWLDGRVQRVASELRAIPWERLRVAVIHGDFNPQNLLFRDNALAAVLDFDLATRDARSADLAIAMRYLCESDEDGGLLTQSLVVSLLDGYESVSGLSPMERKAIPPLLEAKLLRSPMRKLWRLVETPPGERSATISSLRRGVGRLEALDADAGWRFALGR